MFRSTFRRTPPPEAGGRRAVVVFRVFIVASACVSLHSLLLLRSAEAQEAHGYDANAPIVTTRRLFGLLGDAPAWDSFKSRFLRDGGRIVDTANGRISHSEGQGYGMVFAVAAADHDAFRQIWNWTRREMMRRNDALASWRWEPASKSLSDTNNASDGDLLIAWALGEADAAWPNEGFKRDGRRLALDIAQRLVDWTAQDGPLLKPGITGFSARETQDGPVINLSYWVFPAFKRLATMAPEYDWERLSRSGSGLVRRSRFGPAHLPTEWIAMGHGGPEPAPGFSATFSYNAIRIPLYLALAGDMDRADYAPFAELWGHRPGDGLPVLEVETGRTIGWMREPGYLAVAALTRCASGAIDNTTIVLRLSEENYYPASLALLAEMAAHAYFGRCLSQTGP